MTRFASEIVNAGAIIEWCATDPFRTSWDDELMHADTTRKPEDLMGV
jgi:hypothetical protein